MLTRPLLSSHAQSSTHTSTSTFTLITRHSPFEMDIPDPFDRVLTMLGLYQQIQGMEFIPIADVPVTYNDTLEAPCRVQGPAFQPNMPDDIRLELALKFIKYIHPIHIPPPEAATQIHPISLILGLDGTVQAEPIHMLFNTAVYPARYRIPPSMITGLQSEERVWRSEKFALGTLLYELYTGQGIFDGQPDDEVQDQYRTAATFPNMELLPALMQCLIYACWSAEFGHYIFERYTRQPRQAARAIVRAVAVVSPAAAIAVPILGAIGFSAIGPVVRKHVTRELQALIGIVPSPSNLRDAFIRGFREGPGA